MADSLPILKKKPFPSDKAARERVDEIMGQWQAERPDIDPVPVLIYGLLGQLHIQSTAFIDDVLVPFKLTRGTFDVLTALRRTGAPYSLTPKEIAKYLLLSGAGLNSRINKLESLHYVARLPEPTDRRTIRVQLTAQGETVINNAIPAVFDAQWARLRLLEDDTLQTLASDLLKLADAIDRFNETDQRI